MHADKTNTITEAVLSAAFEVSNKLGAGFLEKVYRRALIQEFKLRGIRASEEVSFSIAYKGSVVGQYFADLLVEGEVVVELKCVDSFSKEHMAQCINYLKASGRTVCLLLNFQRTRVEYKRIVHEFEPELS